MGYKDDCYQERYHDEQKHVHELQGSVKLAGEEPHEHRFCTVTGEAIPYEKDHVHEVIFRTDFHDDHYHEFRGRTGCCIQVGDRHVHFIESVTSVDDGHRHPFEAATFIENPTGKDCTDKKFEEDKMQRRNYYRR